MIAFFWGNMYLSSIQQGIQAGHVIGDMSATVIETSKEPDITGIEIQRNFMFHDWASKHKTIIVYNGGYQKNLKKISDALSNSEFLSAAFHEEHDSLNGAMTCVGAIIPEKVYTLAYMINESDGPISKHLSGINDDIFVYRNNNGEMIESQISAPSIKIARIIANSKRAV